MVKRSTPQATLLRLFTAPTASGARRLRRGVTADEVAAAVEVVRLWFPEADLTDRKVSRLKCVLALEAALGQDRVPHPDEDWDLVAVYAWLRRKPRQEACRELGLTAAPAHQAEPGDVEEPPRPAHATRVGSWGGDEAAAEEAPPACGGRMGVAADTGGPPAHGLHRRPEVV